jgi:hypothetical protein
VLRLKYGVVALCVALTVFSVNEIPRRFIQLMICGPTVNKRGASQFQTVWVIQYQWSLK